MNKAGQTDRSRVRFSGMILAIALLTGSCAVYFLSNAAEASRLPVPGSAIDDDLSLEGKRLKGFVFGSEGLMADLYWMQSLQYLGDKFVNAPADQVISLDDLRPLNPRLLYPYLDNATDLDPGFMAAYAYGATVLPAIDPETAIKLTEKGISNHPHNFRLYQYLGFIYWKLHRYDEAAEAYERGSEQPDAPPFMKAMAAYMASNAGSRETARAMYHQMSDSGDQQTRINAEYRLNELDAEEQMEAINAKLANYLERNGSCVRSLIEIVPALGAVKLADGAQFRQTAAGEIVDPKLTPYVLDSVKCVVHSTSFPKAGANK